MLELLAAATPTFAAEFMDGGISTPRVQRAVELSLAPAFLLVGIGSIMNVMMARLIWLAGRIERLAEPSEGACEISHAREIEWLRARRRLTRIAVKFSTGAAVVISLVIAVLFVSAFIEPRIGGFVAVLWVLTVGLLVAGLVYFLRETLMAADGPQGKSI